MLCCLINHKAGQVYLVFLREEYISLFFSLFEISISLLLIFNGLFSSFDDNSISSLESCPEIIGKTIKISLDIVMKDKKQDELISKIC